MAKVFIVNPANASIGFAFITPRWLYVIAGATPTELVGEPIVIDEPVSPFRPEAVRRGDIVGVGINTGNCRPGYRVIQAAKERGATVIVGGIHATLFPEEVLQMGADAVVKGGGDLIWAKIVEDALEGRLERMYDGGRVPGELMARARWDLLDASRYLMGSIQTVAGCPENCSFCSVWVTDGRTPRMHLNDQIIEEANELHAMGLRYVFFADDNFTPATHARIARETNAATRANLERVREARMKLFEEYDRRVPKSLYAFTQMTAESVGDREYLRAMYEKMRIRGALIGVESFTAEGLKETNKTWNPVGQKMVEAIQTVQGHGIMVLASVINGLESDTLDTLRTMREFAIASGTAFAQFPLFSIYPGTKDFHEMRRDWENRDNPDYVPKHKVQMLRDKFWLEVDTSDVDIKHPTLSADDLRREVGESWTAFYRLKNIIKRTRQGAISTMSLEGKVAYAIANLTFSALFPKGVSADNVREKKLGFIPRLFVRSAIALSRGNRDWFGIRPQAQAQVVEEARRAA